MDRAATNQSDIASDSVRALAEAAAQGQTVVYRGKGPARPFLAGVGLDRPFFDDKNRAFWVLQSIGWTGYFILRSLSGLANSMGAMIVVHTLLLTATTLGLVASFVSQPVEVPAERHQLRELLGGRLWPQAVLRIGYGTPAPPTGRRPLAETVIVDQERRSS